MSPVLERLPARRWPAPAGDALIAVRGNYALADDGTDLQPPGYPDLFLKASSSVAGPGDVITTGTPSGVGPLIAGDTVHCTIGHIGAMSVRVR